MIFVFPYDLPVPVDFLNETSRPSKFDGRIRQSSAAEKIAVFQEQRMKPGRIFAEPGMDDVAFHIDQVGRLAFLRRNQGIALIGLSRIILEKSGHPPYGFVGMR